MRPVTSQASVIWQLGRMAEGRDELNGNHVVRVGFFSRAIGESMGLDDDFLETLFLAAPLHDVGNSGIPEAILLKRESLTPREYEIVKQHCVVGERILRDQPQIDASLLKGAELSDRTDPTLDMAALIALTHHEKWDGSGYPQGLSGEQIPIESRIVAVADVFDSLTSQRSHRDPYPFDTALEIIRGASGRHFDPDVYAAFEAVIPEIRAISTSLADTTPESDTTDLWDDDEWLAKETPATV